MFHQLMGSSARRFFAYFLCYKRGTFCWPFFAFWRYFWSKNSFYYEKFCLRRFFIFPIVICKNTLDFFKTEVKSGAGGGRFFGRGGGIFRGDRKIINFGNPPGIFCNPPPAGGIPKFEFSVGHFLHFCAIFGVKIVPITKIFTCGAFSFLP